MNYDFCDDRGALIYIVSTTNYRSLCYVHALISDIFITLHPPQLLPHIQLIPLFRKAVDLPIFHFTYRTRRPLRPLPARLDPIMRLSTMTSLRRIPQQHMPVPGEDDVIADDMQVSDRRHDVGM